MNTLLLTGTQFLGRVMSLVLVIFVARRLGPAMMGIYAFALAFTRVFEVLTNFGADRYIQREVGRRPDTAGPLFTDVFVLKILVYLLCGIAALVYGYTMIDDPFKLWILGILFVGLFFRTHVTSANAFFRACRLARYEAMVTVVLRLVYCGLGLVAVLTGRGLLTLVTLELLAQSAGFLASWWLFHHKIAPFSRRFRWDRVKGLFRAAWNFLLIRIVLIVFSSVDMLMLSMMSGDVVTGFYSAALRLSAAFDFVPDAFTGAFLPVISRNVRENPQAFIRVFQYYFKYLLIVGLGLAAALSSTAQGCVLFVYGEAFLPAVPTLGILAMSLMLDFVNTPLSNALIALDEERKILKNFSLAAVFNIALNAMLIPRYHHNGAAMATLLSEALVFVLQLRSIGWSRIQELGLGRAAVRPCLAGILVFALGRAWWSWGPGGLFPTLLVVGLGLPLFLALMGGISRAEMSSAKALLGLGRRAHGSH